MRIYYVTLNTADEASQISRALLEQRLAVCTNWFPITCAYREEEKIVEEAEMVLIVKTHAEYRSAVEQVIGQHISYTNFFAEITPEYANDSWLQWLNNEVPAKAGAGLGSGFTPWGQAQEPPFRPARVRWPDLHADRPNPRRPLRAVRAYRQF